MLIKIYILKVIALSIEQNWIIPFLNILSNRVSIVLIKITKQTLTNVTTNCFPNGLENLPVNRVF